MGRLWRWVVAFATVAVVDVVVLTATGNGNSGKHDSPGQRLGFVVFVVSAVAVVSLSLVAGVRTWRRRTR